MPRSFSQPNDDTGTRERLAPAPVPRYPRATTMIGQEDDGASVAAAPTARALASSVPSAPGAGPKVTAVWWSEGVMASCNMKDATSHFEMLKPVSGGSARERKRRQLPNGRTSGVSPTGLTSR